jgi:hypothetical protein
MIFKIPGNTSVGPNTFVHASWQAAAASLMDLFSAGSFQTCRIQTGLAVRETRLAKAKSPAILIARLLL